MIEISYCNYIQFFDQAHLPYRLVCHRQALKINAFFLFFLFNMFV